MRNWELRQGWDVREKLGVRLRMGGEGEVKTKDGR